MTFLKRLLTFLITLLIVSGLLGALWYFVLIPHFVTEEAVADLPQESFTLPELAEESEFVDVNESNGLIYVNNEVLVFTRTNASAADIQTFLNAQKAEVDDSLSGIGLYRLTYTEPMTYEELEKLIAGLKANAVVEDASLNLVMQVETDAVTTDSRTPVYPDDPWESNTWNIGAPRGGNWGMEAINAPGAWAYLDRMSTVNVGLIDTVPGNHTDLPDFTSTLYFVDDVTGKTTVNTSRVTAADHGTHVAGTMAARWGNGVGVSGVMADKASLHHAMYYYQHGASIYSNYATAHSYLQAINGLLERNVQVINISQNTSRLIGFAASHGNANAINYLNTQANLAEMGLERIINQRTQNRQPDFVICVAAGNSNNTAYYPDENALYGYRDSRSCITDPSERGGSLALYNNFLSLIDAPAVRDRIIVVGAVGINSSRSTSTATQYSYANFSNVGERVDIVAPGVDVYSTTVSGYDSFSGTSMAAPHVSGAAGLLFASNRSLTGPQVKDILLATTTGRYYHGDDYSGLLNVHNAVISALNAETTPVEQVIQAKQDSGLDLCFVVDTTGSMGDDIDSAKRSMQNILDRLSAKTKNYRVALIDYRDFASRSEYAADYPSKLQLDFSDSNTVITRAINSLTLGNGGDIEETVFSALMEAVNLDWRPDAKKVIIILGDAPPLDPEPISGYTYKEVLSALVNAGVGIDMDDSDTRVTSAMDTSLINVFSIGTNATAEAADFFEDLSDSTGGTYVSVSNSSKVGDAIVQSIEQIDVGKKVNATVDFGADLADQEISLYAGKNHLLTFRTDEAGKFTIRNIISGTYRWESARQYEGGALSIPDTGRNPVVTTSDSYWFTPVLKIWDAHKLPICLGLTGLTAVYIALWAASKVGRKKRKDAPPPADAGQPEPQPEPTEPEVLPAEDPALLPDEQPAKRARRARTAAIDFLCPVCGLATPRSNRFCTQCGHDLTAGKTQPQSVICASCGHVCTHNENFCGNCGAPLNK